jgi:DNA-binding LacI/PurR family transcriptional regulator
MLMSRHNNTRAVPETGRESSSLVGALRLKIRSGGLAPGAFLPTVRALSESGGVAHGTAWRALKTLEAEGLVEARPGRGYRVLPAAGREAEGNTLAYVMDRRNVGPGSWDVLYERLLAEMEGCAARAGARVLKLIMNPGEESLVVGQLASAQLAGLVLDGMSAPLLEWARASGVPAVVVDDWAPELDCDSVVQGNFEGGELAARHLLGLGCQRIAWLGYLGNHHNRFRYGGVCAALAVAGKRLAHDVNCDGSAAELEAKAAKMLSGPERADGVVAFWRPAWNPIARAARAAGLELGRDLQAVCWCAEEIMGERYAALFDGAAPPPAVAWSIRSMAELALSRLAERRRCPGLPASTTRLRMRLLSGLPGAAK